MDYRTLSDGEIFYGDCVIVEPSNRIISCNFDNSSFDPSFFMGKIGRPSEFANFKQDNSEIFSGSYVKLDEIDKFIEALVKMTKKKKEIEKMKFSEFKKVFQDSQEQKLKRNLDDAKKETITSYKVYEAKMDSQKRAQENLDNFINKKIKMN